MANALLFGLLGIMAYVFLGCIVIAAVDRNEELMKWYHSAPGSPRQRWILQGCFWAAWPAVVCLFLLGGRH